MICLLWADSVEVRYFVVVSGWQWFGVIWIESHAQLSKDLESTHRSVYTWIETWVTLNDTQKGEPYIVWKYDIHLVMFAFSLHLVMMKDITMFLCKIRLIKFKQDQTIYDVSSYDYSMPCTRNAHTASIFGASVLCWLPKRVHHM